MINCPRFWDSWIQCRTGMRDYPPYTSSGKREFLRKSEILEEQKIRTFLIVSLEQLMDEKILYGTQDDNMKKHQPGWIRYGINFHDGGFDRFVKDSIADFFVEYDVRGWDRRLPILQFAMDIRNEFLRDAVGEDLWREIGPIAERVTRAVVNHKLLLPNGDVVQWDWSQMSGDGMTTSNNCLCHEIIFAYLLIRAAPGASDEQIIEQLCNLYGDDVFAGLTEMFARVKSSAFVDSVYGEFGMALKPGTFKCQVNPEGMSFLGATVHGFKLNGETYFSPYYNRDRILTALQRGLDPLTPDEELMKVFSLLELGWYNCYDEIAGYAQYLLKVVPDSPVKQAFLRKGLPSRDDIRDKWAGVYGLD